MAKPSQQYSSTEHGGLEVVSQDQAGLQVDKNHQSDPISMTPDQEGLQVNRNHQSDPISLREDVEKPQFLGHSDLELAELRKDGRWASLDQLIPVNADESAQNLSGGAPAHTAAAEKTVDASKQRRMCGLSRKSFIILLCVIGAVVIAAVVGGVVGAVLSGKKSRSFSSDDDSADTSITLPGGGFALVTDPARGSRLLMYYGVDSVLYENVEGDDDTWSSTANSTSNVTTSAVGLDSPIAAIAYYSSDTYARQVFFQNEVGILMSSTSTTLQDHLATAWTQPAPLADTPGSTSNSTGLAACVANSTDGLNGIRVYYGTNAGLVQELQYSFNDSASGWMLGMNWTTGDAASGIGCVVNGDASQIDVYWRNPKSSAIQQASRQFGAGDDRWTQYDLGNLTMAQGSDIAVCFDDEQTEYVFFQDTSGTILRGSVATTAHRFGETPLRLQAASANSKLAATWAGSDAWYLFQNSSDPNTDDSNKIWFSGVNRNGGDAGGQVAISGRPLS